MDDTDSEMEDSADCSASLRVATVIASLRMATVTASLGPVGPLLRSLDGVSEGQIQSLRKDLDGLCVSLMDHSEAEEPSSTAMSWMSEIRELCYDIKNYFDDAPFILKQEDDAQLTSEDSQDEDSQDDDAQPTSEDSQDEDAQLTSQDSQEEKQENDQLEFMLLVARAKHASERRERYEIELQNIKKAKFLSEGRRRLPVLDGELIDGGCVDTLANKLMGTSEEKQLKAVSLVGLEGVGKTTLAKRLYHQIGGQFECRAFVRVSANPDMRMLLTSIFTQIQLPGLSEHACCLDAQHLIKSIKHHLGDKRYLIIIDDLWSISVWDVIRRAFPDDGRGSRIITTTQFDDVASACCSYQSEYIFEMEPLKDYESRKLLFCMVFGSKDHIGCSEDFIGVSDGIISKCGGLPLLIVNIASLLPTPSKEYSLQWMDIQDSLPSTIGTSEGTKEVLNLIYNNLSPEMKTCLLYLAMYPEGYTVDKNDLMKQWVAEGFTGEGQDKEEIAREYFDGLVSRGMIQAVDINYGEVLSCTLHHMVHDLIVKKSMEGNFVIGVDYFQSAVWLPGKVRRLSVQFGGARSARLPAGISLSEVRSLAFFGFYGCADFIEKCKLLRVLTLHVWADDCVHQSEEEEERPEISPSGEKEVLTYDLSGFSKLLPLRYLKVACNVAVKLPDEIEALQYLEMLEVDATIAAIPSAIGELSRLSSLNIAVRELSVQDIRILQALQALSALSLHVWTTPAEMIVFYKGEFLVLKYFKFRCSVPWLKFQAGSMPDLRNLNLCFNADEADQHGTATISIEHLPGLKEITAEIWGADTFRTAISNHPSNPRIHVQLVDRIFHGEEKKKQAADSRQRQPRQGGRGGGPGAVADEPAVADDGGVQVRGDLQLGGGEAGRAGRHHRQELPGAGMLLHGFLDRLTGKNKEAWKEGRIRGTAVLVKRDFHASLLDGAHKILGKDGGVSFHLVSATAPDPNNGKRGKVGKAAHLEAMVVTLKSTTAGESVFKVTFDWDGSQGIPGAVVVRNTYRSEFLLKTLTLDGVPGKGTVVFVANSWIYPGADRVFFANDTYLPSKMPALLVQYRQEELNNLRGDSTVGEYKEHDRVYRYDYYNDLGEPDRGEKYARPILGGSQELPYPRRGRTGRRPTKADPKSESRIPLVLVKKALEIYVPRDERFGHLKSDFLGYSLKAITEAILPIIRTYVDTTPKEFDSFQDIYNLYDGLLQVPHSPALAEIKKKIPFEFVKSILPVAGDDFLNLPLPQVIKSDKFAWRTDEEFAREMLAGVNPVCIRRVTEFPVKSTLDHSVYGDQTSKITEAQIQPYLEEGLTVKQALESNRLFILDHHDNFMPFLERINKLEGNYIYASRTLLFLKSDGTLKPLAIELSLPHPDGIQHGAESTVYPPANDGVDGQIWQLAKAYACVNDSAWHQLISHWLNTHAVIEPFVIATNRQLSVVHPVHKLLSPHYRDTMNINALARMTLINAGGVFELTVFPGKYALEMSSVVYKNWKLTEQGLPDDLVKRGMAVRDPSSPYNVRLLIKDYPYAVDGLVIWWAIEQWVKEYLAIYYPNDGALRADKELEEWWKEVREVGHGDLKDKDWWPKMETVEELAKTCTTIIWVASALHAAVNFGQYPYAGYLPNRPTVSRRPMPVKGSEEYAQLERGGEDADRVFIHTITSQFQTILGITLIEILSKHASDEVYLGQRDTPEWTSDAKALEAFKRFGTRLVEIEKRIVAMNKDPALKNRNGPVNMPYTLLYPNTSDATGEKGLGLTGMGIPNSVSI